MSRRKTKAAPARGAAAENGMPPCGPDHHARGVACGVCALDVRVGPLRIRCASAVACAAEDDVTLTDDEEPLSPGDLLIDDGHPNDWRGTIIVRAADRAQLVAVLFAAPAPAAGGGR